MLVRLLNSTKSTSDNTVSVQRAGDKAVTVQSDATLNVEISVPGFLPLPKGPMERQGSELCFF